MLSSSIETLLKDLRERAKHNQTRGAQHLKPDSEDAIIKTLLALAEERDRMKERLGKLDNRRS
jgi:hypothetical protein